MPEKFRTFAKNGMVVSSRPLATLKAAKQIGLTILPNVLAKADKVIR